MKGDDILNSFEIEVSRLMVKVKVVIFRKNIFIALAPSFTDRFYCIFTQMFNMKNILIKFKFQLSRAKVIAFN